MYWSHERPSGLLYGSLLAASLSLLGTAVLPKKRSDNYNFRKLSEALQPRVR